MSKLRKILFAVAAFGGAVTAVGAGTFASFTASTTNTGTFSTGNLVLTNDSPQQTGCLSTTDAGIGTNSSACTAMTTVSLAKPGDSASWDITVSNASTIDAATLKLFASGACTKANAAGQSFNGGADAQTLCTAMDFSVTEYNHPTTRTVGAAVGCVYGVDTTPADNVCDADNHTKNLWDFGANKLVDNAITLSGTLPKKASGTCSANTQSPAGSCRFFRVSVKMDIAAGNNMQGLAASTGFTWSIAS
jgi:predicted ribosomally synthesized peptide with SipW-like signal peptide